MKTKTLFLSLILLFTFFSGNVFAAVEHGSICEKDLSLTLIQGEVEPSPEARVEFKLVTLGSLTYAYVDGTGYTLANTTWASQIRYEGEKQCPLADRLGNRSIWSFVTPNPETANLYVVQEDDNNFLATAEFSYNKTTQNSSVAGDDTAPVLSSAEYTTVTDNSITLSMAAADANDFFYYIESPYMQTVSFFNELTISGLVAGTDYAFTVIAIDFSGNESAPIIVNAKTTGEAVGLEASEYCQTAVTVSNKTANYTIETNAEGDIVVSILGYGGDQKTYFRGAGWQNTGTLNVGGANVVFTKTDGDKQDVIFPDATRNVFSTFKLSPATTILPGTKVTYSGTAEFTTNADSNAWGTISISYTYGTSCAGLPMLSAEPGNVSFSPTQGTQTFTLTGTDLEGELTLKAPKGLSVTPITITPEADGTVNATITVKWIEGTANGNTIQISGGGLVAPLVVGVQTTGFSNHCNRIINQNAVGRDWPAYLLVTMNEDKTVMYFDIAAVNENDVATWGRVRDISVADGAANELVASNATSDDKTRITVTFNQALNDGDIVKFGYLVWTIENTVDDQKNTNIYIDGWQPDYTVGLTCNLDNVGPGTSVNQISSETITFYPNPATEVINFTTEVKAVNIYSLQGQMILSQANTNMINVSTLAKGMYIVKAVDNNGKQISSKVEIR